MPNVQQTATSGNLTRLCVIRAIVLGSMLLALGAARAYGIALPYRELTVILLVWCAVAALTWLRARRRWPVTELEFFLHVLADIAGLGLLLYFSGGATNPFISYFLVPLSLTAALLPWRYTWALAALCIGLYSLLLVYYQPVGIFSLHQHGAPRLNPHFIGMWVNFTLSALIITFFLVRMARALREREQLLNQMREDDLRDQQIMAVATLAAGTAHELGTPLSTMKILLEELETQAPPGSPLAADLALLEAQVDTCRATLKKLVATADRNQSGQLGRLPAASYCRDLIDSWRLLHPATRLDVHLDPELEHRVLAADPTLKQALINLLDNAGSASPGRLEVTITAGANAIELEILDDGPGVPGDIAERLGKPIIIASEGGLGIGLLLTHATLTRFGGSVTLYNRPMGGTRTVATLPATSP